VLMSSRPEVGVKSNWCPVITSYIMMYLVRDT
jgi:hypothetical protein